MFGSFRFLLAAAVLLSHTTPVSPGFHTGVSAVVMFYVLSGYVMTGLLERHYSALSQVASFYVDRLMRIYPQYLFVLCLTLLGYWVGLVRLPAGFAPDLTKLFFNLTIIPLNYFMFIPEANVAYIPPAWSLGAELQFYLLFPFVFLLGGRKLTLLLSLLVFTIASFQVIPTNTHSYRLLSGVMFMFLMGSMVYDYNHGKQHLKRWIVGIYVYLCVLLVVLITCGLLSWKENSHSIFIGLVLGFPVFYYLSRLERKAWDEFWGDLSYGLFLSHIVVLWSLERWSFFRLTRESYDSLILVGLVACLKIFLVFIGSLALSYIGFRWVESPVLAYRKKMRQPKESESTP